MTDPLKVTEADRRLLASLWIAHDDIPPAPFWAERGDSADDHAADVIRRINESWSAAYNDLHAKYLAAATENQNLRIRYWCVLVGFAAAVLGSLCLVYESLQRATGR